MILKSFKLFESIDSHKIHEICNKYEIGNYSINEDRSIDVDGNVNLNSCKLSKLPIKFGRVNGDFDCRNNQLTSLEGSPSHVGFDFYCNHNQLTSLEGAPSHVGFDFYCRNNQLTSRGCSKSCSWFLLSKQSSL